MGKIKFDANDIRVYTDGSHSPSTNNGGWGYCVVRNGQEILCHSGSVADTTNNRMELLAILNALLHVDDPIDLTKNLLIFSDSANSVNVIREVLAKRRDGIHVHHKRFANYDLVNQIVLLCLRRRVIFNWLKGHAGHRWNGRADELAVNARIALDLKTP